MFTTHLITFKSQEKELHQQAAQYRLVKTLDRNNSLANRFYESLGKMMIFSGEEVLKNNRAAAH